MGGAQKKAHREHRTLVLVDETGHSFRARTGSTWARRGCTPVLRRLSKRREVSSICGISLKGKLVARHYKGSIDSALLIRSLRHFQRHFGRRLLIVWDRLNAHRSAVTQAFLDRQGGQIAIAFLPPYAPELNPEEQCNAWVKREMQNILPLSIEELHAEARRTFRRLQHRPEMIVNFFDHAGLSVH